MCKSMNALFCPFMNKEQESSFWTNCPEVQIKKKEKACKKSHISVDMKKVTRADGSITHTAFCEVKSIDQMATLLKMASEQVLEEQKEMTKILVLYDDKGKEVMSADFVNNGEINMDDVRNFKIVVVIVTAVQSLA